MFKFVRRLLRGTRKTSEPETVSQDAVHNLLWREQTPTASPPVEIVAPMPVDDPVEGAEFPPDRFRLLHVQNRVGSVEHYFHFILGFVAPLLLRPAEYAPGTRGLIISCGILDDRLAELGIGDVTVIPKARWYTMLNARTHKRDRMDGYDHPDHYDAVAFARLREAMLQRLGDPDASADERVIVVDRGRSPDFYQSEAAQNKTSANLRRSVPNMAEAVRRLQQAGIDAVQVELETADLRGQVRMFAAASTMVAQHGAALVNMLWMKPGGTVVEIQPQVASFSTYFSALAAACGHRHLVVQQDGNHAPIDPGALVQVLRGLDPA